MCLYIYTCRTTPHPPYTACLFLWFLHHHKTWWHHMHNWHVPFNFSACQLSCALLTYHTKANEKQRWYNRITSLFQTILNRTYIRQMSTNTGLQAMFVKNIVTTHSALMGILNSIRRLYSTSLLTETPCWQSAYSHYPPNLLWYITKAKYFICSWVITLKSILIIP